MKQNYVEHLIAEYSRRKSSNSRYSERAFARDLGLSAGYLKLLFQNKRRLSLKRAQELVVRIGWSELQKRAFCESVQRGGKPTKHVLSETEFFEISDWYHFAIVELLRTCKGSLTQGQIGLRLGLARDEVGFALSQMKRLKFLRQGSNGKFSLPRSYEVPSCSSAAIRKYHRQTLEKALQAIEGQSIAERDLRGLTLAFDPARLAEAQSAIAKFVESFDRCFGGSAGTEVYQLNLALYRLTKGEK